MCISVPLELIMLHKGIFRMQPSERVKNRAAVFAQDKTVTPVLHPFGGAAPFA